MSPANNRTTTTKKTKRRLTSPVRKTKQGLFVRLLQKFPPWTWWLLIGGIVIIYLCFFYYFFVSPFGIRWRALYGGIDNPQGYNVRGIDISHHQGKIDWDKLRREGLIDDVPVRFIMVKATEGSNLVDKCYSYNFKNARDYGYVRGAYHFWSNLSGAETQAYNFINNVDLVPGDLPPVLDVEQASKKISNNELRDSLVRWLTIVEDHYGVKPIIYTYKKFKKKHLTDTIFNSYPHWIAHYYVDSLDYSGKWHFWQHTDCGKMPGIEELVDLNIFNGSYEQLLEMTIMEPNDSLESVSLEQ